MSCVTRSSDSVRVTKRLDGTDTDMLFFNNRTQLFLRRTHKDSSFDT